MAEIKLKLDPTQVSEEVLQALLDEGIIQPGQLEDAYMQTGEMREELWAEVEHLDGIYIGMGEACDKYTEINIASLSRWIKQGFIRTRDDSPRGGGRGRKRLLTRRTLPTQRLCCARGENGPGSACSRRKRCRRTWSPRRAVGCCAAPRCAASGYEMQAPTGLWRLGVYLGRSHRILGPCCCSKGF